MSRPYSAASTMRRASCAGVAGAGGGLLAVALWFSLAGLVVQRQEELLDVALGEVRDLVDAQVPAVILRGGLSL